MGPSSTSTQSESIDLPPAKAAPDVTGTADRMRFPCSTFAFYLHTLFVVLFFGLSFALLCQT